MVENLIKSSKLRALGELKGSTIDYSDLYPWIFRLTGVPEGTILDVGSNETRFYCWLKSQGLERKVISLDIRDLGYQHDFVRATAKALPFKDSSFDNVVSVGLSQLIAGTDYEAQFYNEIMSVARKRIIIWPTSDRVVAWLKNHLGLKIQTYDLYPNSESPEHLKTLMIEKRWFSFTPEVKT
ncbi:hypothetical protein A2Z23_01235 [Candidatus Curtissbacteria bacterium RBG_16_39_7]|uniref:Methyltransferase type 11 domain-containing protein n=1 Tax=Candidatus Curtissbacteria bacterium RBG_16_39_7 TaxID=1797707 RepID=A0A1F5G2E6_9BACT|nr:MAG: hypothetical protein A2Z23_01235 [Candidatus Curtissbacteria bacterium RBG_16_39_7]